MKPEWRWPVGIVAILASSVIANIAFMLVANNDPSFAVEPDYYRRAVAFDTTMQEARLSNALGWTTTATIDSVRMNVGVVRLQIRDRADLPVVVDSVHLTAFFNGRANDVTRAALAPDSARGLGHYVARLSVTHFGQWELQFDARRGEAHFVARARIDVVRAIDQRVVAVATNHVVRKRE